MWAAKFGFGIGAGATIWGMEEKYDAIDNATAKLFTTVGRMDYGQSSKGSKNNEVN